MIHKLAIAGVLALMLVSAVHPAPEMISNGGFEDGLSQWTLWGTNANLITLDSTVAHSGKNSARIQVGHNALYRNIPVSPGKAYEIHFFYRLEGRNAEAEVALSYNRAGGAHRSAGFKLIPILSGQTAEPTAWSEIREVFVPSLAAGTCQVAFQGKGETVLWIDDVSIKEVPRPAGLNPLPDPWQGMAHRTANPLFKELLTKQPGNYTMVSWTHNLNSKNLPQSRQADFPDAARWTKQVEKTYRESAANGLGYMDLPGKATDLHDELHRKYGVKFDVWTEGSATTSAALKKGAELLNPKAAALGTKKSVSVVDPAYVDAQEKILTDLAVRLKGLPYIGVYYGKDEPSVHLPQTAPAEWGTYSKQMAKEVMNGPGCGKFAAPVPKDPAFENDPSKPLRWIAYNRWASDRWYTSRLRLHNALHKVEPNAVYSPADYWFMTGFTPFDYPRLASFTDMFEIDPYASSAERRRGRGVYNHGFGAKFMSDITGKPVRIIAQAFDYAGYAMNPEDLREWLSQSMRCGASAISYYTLDNPQYTAPDRWKMMLHLSNVISKMNRVALPKDPDTAILYASYTHMSDGLSTGGDQIYAAHALIGELVGSWYKFVADTQLERGQRTLRGYKVVYLPRGKYMTPEATAKIEAYVRGGGTLVCGDAEAFSIDLKGNDTTAARERILGVRIVGPKDADGLILKSQVAGSRSDLTLPLFDISLWGEKSKGRAQEIRPIDDSAWAVGTYPDRAPAVVVHKLGKGRVITFAANPFSPEVTVEKTRWPMVFKTLQKSFGCKVDRPIWRFALPRPE